MSLTKIGSIGINTGIQFAGVTTVSTLHVGSGVTLSSDGDIFATGISTFSEDIKVGSGVTISPDGDVFFTGIATGNGSGLTALNASNLGSGTVPTARLGSGTASSSTFLRGDSTFQTVSTDLVDDTTPQLGGNLDVNTKNILFGDSSDGSSDDALIFGAGSDLIIYHDGSNSFIKNSTGNLRIQDTNGNIQIQAKAGEDSIIAKTDGAVELYHDNAKRLETSSAGVKLLGSGTDAIDMTGDVWFNNNEHAGADIYFNSGDKHLIYEDNVKAKFGGAGDLEVYHDGSNSYLKAISGGTGDLYIFAPDKTIYLRPKSGEDGIKVIPDGAVELYHDGTKMFETASYGVAFATNVRVNSDSSSLQIGAGQDLKLHHTSNNSYLTNDTGYLYVQSDSISLAAKSAGENYLVANKDGSVSLYYDNSRKFFTQNLGITVESTGNTPEITFRGASDLDMGKIHVDQFSTNFSAMSFFTMSSGSEVERMRLLDNGNLCVMNDPSVTTANLQSPGQGNGNTAIGVALQEAGRVIANSSGSFSSFGRNDTGLVVSFTRSGGDQGGISVAPGSVSYGSGSDYRLKENVVSLTDGITRIKQLIPKRFNFIEDTTKTLRDGFLAHEVSSIVPEAITGTKDEVDSDNKPVYQQIDQAKLVPLLTAALQEEIAKREALEARVSALEG